MNKEQNQEELEELDIYNINKEKTGKVVERKRGTVLDKDEYIISVQCWIINSKGEILLTQRRLDKKDGGKWEPTTGLILSGENGIQGMKRELQEEISVVISEEDLILARANNRTSGNGRIQGEHF